MKKRAYLDHSYWAKPVPSFGDSNARLALVGLAPGAHGSNRTGRMFTGDASGDFLYPALHRAGFANRSNAVAKDDGLTLRDCLITAAVRCAPPNNKPSPSEMRNCFPYLVQEFAALARLRVIVGLGAIGMDAALKALRELGFDLEPRRPQFGHGVETRAVREGRTVVALASYHPSRQNTNTGKLTRPMFDAIFTRANELLGEPRPSP